MKTEHAETRPLLIFLLMAGAFFLFLLYNFINLFAVIGYDFSEILNNFTILVMSILLEAFPFILLGAFVSALIQQFVSEEMLAQILPKNRFAALVMAAFMGIVFPVCECAIVPIMRRLVKKGVPIHVAITFMLAVPIVNPVVLVSTYYAFSSMSYYVLLRGGLGALAAILIGHFAGRLAEGQDAMRDAPLDDNCACGADHSHSDEIGHSCTPVQIEWKRRLSKGQIALTLVRHTGHELYAVGRYLIFGAVLSGILQVFVPRTALLAIGSGSVQSIIVLMALAFILSLCSEADAFIARTFVGQFSSGAIAAFLIFGPMLDLKNTLMLSGTFKWRYLWKLMLLIAGVSFVMGLLVNAYGI